MEGEPGVLQQRVQVVAVERRNREPQERVRGQEDEQQEGDRDRRLHAERPRPEPRRQVAPETGDAAPKRVRISIHSSIEPSWFPQVPATL